jgi:hypothetical protein
MAIIFGILVAALILTLIVLIVIFTQNFRMFKELEDCHTEVFILRKQLKRLQEYGITEPGKYCDGPTLDFMHPERYIPDPRD